MPCDKNSCNAAKAIKEMQNLIESQRMQHQNELNEGYLKSYEAFSEVKNREIDLQEELELTKAELEKTKAELAAALAPKNMLGREGFKACAEVTFIPKQEESK